MPDHGTPTGRDLHDHILHRLDAAEAKMRARHGAAILSSMHRGDRNAVPAPVEGQTIIQHDTNVPYFYSSGSWRTFCTSGSGGDGTTGGPFTHIHQIGDLNTADFVGDNDAGNIRNGGRNLDIAADAGASDGKAAKWTAPSYTDFEAAYDDTGTSAVGDFTTGGDYYVWNFADCDIPFPGNSRAYDFFCRVRVRGTDSATTYNLTIQAFANGTSPTAPSFFQSSPGTDITPAAHDAGQGDFYNQTWTGTTSYVDLTSVFSYDPAAGTPNFYIFGWYATGGSGDIYMDKITITWPV